MNKFYDLLDTTMPTDNIKDEDRYWQVIKCEFCQKFMGMSTFYKVTYQCTDCNKLPENWDRIKEWRERYKIAND